MKTHLDPGSSEIRMGRPIKTCRGSQNALAAASGIFGPHFIFSFGKPKRREGGVFHGRKNKEQQLAFDG